MPIDISNDIISGSSFDTSANILNTPTVVTRGLVLWYDVGNIASYNGSGFYYDCGYGCQFYASDPGCVHCDAQIKDMSGYGNDGTFSGNTTVFYYNTGSTGGSMFFDGTTDYVSVGTATSYNSITNVTAEVWCFPIRTSSSTEYLISNSLNCCGSYKGFNLQLINSIPRFQIYNTSSGATDSSSAIVLNKFYQIVGTYDGSNINLYVNGQLSGTTSFATGLGTPASYSLDVGKRASDDTRCYRGYISVVRVYNQALTAAEVLQNFNEGRQRYGVPYGIPDIV